MKVLPAVQTIVLLISLFAVSMASAARSVFHNPEEGEKLMNGCAEFALSMYKNIAASEPGNVFFSPISISMALAMTYLGARNETQAQMKAGLSFGKLDDNELHKSFSDLRAALKGGGAAGFTLDIANRLFGQKTYKFLDEFLNATRDLYGAELGPVDFIAHHNAAVAEINGWVADHTNQKIKDIVPLSAVNDLTRLILVNATYFKGDWTKKFDAALTKVEDFHISPGKKVRVPLMHIKDEEFLYGVDDNLKCQALELPYASGNLSMFILLPDRTVTTLREVEGQLTINHLFNVREHFRMFKRDVNVWLPRFKLDKEFDLKEVLKCLGIADLFEEGTADLSGMAGNKDLYVSAALHKAFVEVNEEGSEAAAATAVICALEFMMIKQEINFRADNPFLFFIMENSSKAILFLGKFSQP